MISVQPVKFNKLLPDLDVSVQLFIKIQRNMHCVCTHSKVKCDFINMIGSIDHQAGLTKTLGTMYLLI